MTVNYAKKRCGRWVFRRKRHKRLDVSIRADMGEMIEAGQKRPEQRHETGEKVLKFDNSSSSSGSSCMRKTDSCFGKQSEQQMHNRCLPTSCFLPLTITGPVFSRTFLCQPLHLVTYTVSFRRGPTAEGKRERRRERDSKHESADSKTLT